MNKCSNKLKAAFHKCFRVLVFAIIALLIIIVITNGWVIMTSKPLIISEEKALSTLSSSDEEGFKTALVLGAGLWSGKPTPLLKERLNTAVSLYNAGLVEQLIMSGDSLDPSDYDEVRAMREYAIDCGVPEGAIISDELGLNTHASVYRAMHIFGKSRFIIITQNYHLERAVFLAKCFGADAIGVYCDKERLGGQSARDAREVLARVKDFFVGLFKLVPRDYMLEIRE